VARKSARRFDPLAVTAEIVAIAFWCDLPTPNLVATNASDLSAMHQRANTPANTLAQDPWALNDRDYEIGRNPSTALRDFVARRFDPAVAWNGHTNRCADPLEHRGAHVGGQQLVGFDDPRKRRRT
jgi:hypothetical protein